MRLTGFAGRLAAIAILVGVIVLLQGLLGQPLVDSFIQHRDSIARSQETLLRYKRLSSSQEQTDAALRQVKEAQQNEERLLSGDSVQLAGAKLQNRLKELIEANDGSLGSAQLLPVRQEEGFQRVSMAVTLRSTLESLQSILYEIETHSPYLFIEKLELAKGSSYAYTDDTEDQSALQVNFELYGYMPGEAR